MTDHMGIGLFLIRAVIGSTLMAHGVQKLSGLDGAGAAFEHIGFVPGRRNALFAGLAESLAGIAMLLGLATPAAVAVDVALMFVASAVHLKNGFFVQKNGFEYALVLGVAGFSLAFTGPGRYSLDALLGLDLAGLQWGVVALVLGLLGGGAQLATRRPVAAPHKA